MTEWIPLTDETGRLYSNSLAIRRFDTDWFPPSLIDALKHPFMTAYILENTYHSFPDSPTREHKMDCNIPPAFYIYDNDPEQWVIVRKVKEYRPYNQYACRDIFITRLSLKIKRDGSFYAVCSGGSMDVKVTVICDRWDRLRKVVLLFGRACILLQNLYNEIVERRYAPGGEGYTAAGKSFEAAVGASSSQAEIADDAEERIKRQKWRAEYCIDKLRLYVQ